MSAGPPSRPSGRRGDSGGRPAGPALRLALLLGSATGGTARHVAALARGCRDAGLAVAVFGPEESRGMFAAAGISFTPVSIGDRPHPASDAAAIAGLRRLLRTTAADVLHAHGVRAGAFAVLATRGPGAARRPALVVTVHNAAPAGRVAGAIYGILERMCARRSDLVLCASEDLAARMRALGAASARTFHVPAAPAPPPTATEVAKAAGDIDAAGRPVVLAVGRLAPQKGFDVLIAAAGRWRDHPLAPRTVIAGSGPLAGPLADQARRLGADVLLLGERHDVPALLVLADVFVLPSRWEARALILQEAMRAGRAIVATESGGTPGLTGAGAAVLVAPEDDRALADAVLALLSDAPMAARLGLAARARAASFPTEADAVSQAVSLYRGLAARGSAA
jgi:glycosyltransferase involved in cell wall biosynthesis